MLVLIPQKQEQNLVAICKEILGEKIDSHWRQKCFHTNENITQW